MRYTAEEKDLIEKWRPYYAKLISDAILRVVQKEKELIPSYIPEKLEELNTIEKIAKKIDISISKGDGEDWDRSYYNHQYNNPAVIYCLVEKAMKENPEQTGTLEGISLLHIALNVMKITGESCTNRWLLNVLDDFYKIYESDPGITDTDAMIRFIHKEDVIKSPEDLDSIPQEIRESLDLNFDDNLKPFLEQYKDCLTLRASGESGVSALPLSDVDPLQKEEQSSTDNQFKERVAKDDDGVYRWTYDRRGSELKPKEVFWIVFKSWFFAYSIAFITLIGLSAIVMYILTNELGGELLYILFMSVLLFVLISAVLSWLFANFTYRSCLRDYYTYEMKEKSIRPVPGTEMALRTVKRMVLFPEYDLILLGISIIYVPSEDFQMVQEFLRSRIHRKAKIVTK